MTEFVHGKPAKVKHSDEVGEVVFCDPLLEQVELKFKDNSFKVFKFKDVEHVEANEMMKSVGFEELGSNIGKLVEKKQQAYGNSIDKTYKLMQVFLEGYDNGNNTYTIPKSLLKHILLQVRIIDKQNRIFSNPDGDLMEENPYSDCAGYSLLGMRMVEDGSH
jgi:hypothetical protein